MKIKKALLIERDSSLRDFLKERLSKNGLEVHPAKEVKEGILTGIVAHPQIIFYNRTLDYGEEPLKKALSKVASLERVTAVPYDYFPSDDPERADAGREDLLDSLMIQLELDEGLQEEETDSDRSIEQPPPAAEKSPPPKPRTEEQGTSERLGTVEGFRKRAGRILAKSSVDITQRIEEILKALCEGFGLEQADLYLLDAENRQLVLRSSTGALMRFAGQIRVPVGAGLLSDGLEGGVFLASADPKKRSVWREAYLPLKAGGRATGVLVLQRGAAALTPKLDEEGFDEIAEYLGQEIEKEVARHLADQRLLKLSTLGEQGLGLLALEQVEQITSVASASAALLVGVEAVILRLHENRVWWIGGSFGLGQGPESKKLIELDEALVREQVLPSGMPLILNDLKEAKELPAGFRYRGVISVPIRQGEKWIGVLSLYNKLECDPLIPPNFTLEDNELLSKYVGYLARALTQARKRQTLESMPGSDPLTGLKDKNYFRGRLTEELERAARHGRNLGLVLVEIERFGELARTLGEEISNELVQKVALLLNETFRNVDVVARLSEGRFGVILPDTGESLIEGIARLEKKLSALRFPEGKQKPAPVRFLAGWSYFPGQATNPEDLLRRASKLSPLRGSPPSHA
jgi:diguanylate cyclase (GGDEF)-like protein